MKDLENTIPRYQERYQTISASVPSSLKRKLMDRAYKLDISLSELVFNMIIGKNENENEFSQELTNIRNENEALKARVRELEGEVFDLSDARDTIKDNFDNSELTIENLVLYVEQLQKSLCRAKSLLFETFAEKSVYKFSDEQTVIYVQKELKPALENQISKGLESIASFVKNTKNLNKLSPEQLKTELEKTFDFKPDFAAIQSIDADFKKWYYQSYKEDILKEFEPLNEKVSSPIEDFDFSDLENVCYLDVDTDFEHILQVEVQNLGYSVAEEKPEPITKEEPTPAIQKQEPIAIKPKMEVFKSKEEKILASLFSEKIEYVTEPELKALGFNTGFWSKLTSRGATYGNYKLEKAPSEKVFKVQKV